MIPPQRNNLGFACGRRYSNPRRAPSVGAVNGCRGRKNYQTRRSRSSPSANKSIAPIVWREMPAPGALRTTVLLRTVKYCARNYRGQRTVFTPQRNELLRQKNSKNVPPGMDLQASEFRSGRHDRGALRCLIRASSLWSAGP
jgi:hypothetical protein